MADEGDIAPWDPVSKGLGSTGFGTLEQAAAEFARSSQTPVRVATLLERARKQFTTAGMDYDNFTSCIQTSFTAIENLLRKRLGDLAPKNAGVNGLAEKALKEGLVSREDAEYLVEFVRVFRNKMAHDGDLRITPEMSREILGGCHQFVASFCDAQYGQ